MSTNFEEQDHEIIQKIKDYSDQSVKPKIRATEYDLPWAKCVSWNMLEWGYTKGQYPSHARGLFTSTRNGKHYVAVRGYDKFFNVDEIEQTKWSHLLDDTQGPYEVTAKENGCIIFIAAMSRNEVVVTSKHTIPNIKDDVTKHAGVGYRWLLEHLHDIGKSEGDLARWLHDKKVTMVAELCDDDFEEHILPYDVGERGLYLHGINDNHMIWHTWSMDAVTEASKEFGLRVVQYQIFPDLPAVREFLDTNKKAGIFDDRDIEGAVIRGKRKKDGSTIFFKIKKDYYRQYREYREVTRKVLVITRSKSSDPPQVTYNDEAKLKHFFPKTPMYLKWLKDCIHTNPEWFYDFNANKNIIAVRQEFESALAKGEVPLTGDEKKKK